MVLAVGNSIVSEPSSDLESFLASSSKLREDAETFKAKKKAVIKENHGLLYINQHEFAVTHPDDPHVRLLGSEDATTCHVVILRQPITGVTALAHIDDSRGGAKNLRRLSDRIFEVSRRVSESSASTQDSSDLRTLEISLIGGFRDEQAKSEELSVRLIDDLVSSDINFILGLCCIGSLNTCLKKGCTPFPVLYGCAVDVVTGDIFPAEFDSHGPENILRHVRCCFNADATTDLYEIYDSARGLCEIRPFRFASFPWLDLWLSASPADILQNMSTSPEVEPAHFVVHLRAAMALVKENPAPLRTVFQGGKPIRYRRGGDSGGGKWVKVEEGSL